MTTINIIQSLTDAQLLAVKKETVRRIVRETGSKYSKITDKKFESEQSMCEHLPEQIISPNRNHLLQAIRHIEYK